MTKLAWFLSFCTGFISLSEEILWVRIISFAFESTPRAFALVLTSFLGGIALGALVGKQLSERQKATPATAASILLLSGGLLLVLPSIVTEISQHAFSTLLMLLLILLSATLKGTLFPIVHHLGSKHSDSLGRSVSRTYFFNILGSTLGPLVTGLFLLDNFSSGNSLQILGVLCFLSALAPLSLNLKKGYKRSSIVGVTLGLSGLLAFPLLQPVGSTLMHKLAAGSDHISVLIENRYGIVHSVANSDEHDTVYGGNVYDGKTNIDLVINSNMIDRAYLLYGLHPKPKNILVIGLSSGAWTRIIGAIPNVEKIDVVEINPGYIKLIRNYAHLSPLLDDPRLNLHIDDGRRWLRRSQDKFDLIVMNTTFHWRSNATSLLSKEMMELVKEALAPEGIFAFNTTNSLDAFYTAAHSFTHAYLFRNFVYAANHDFRQQQPHMIERLRQFELNGRPVFSETPEIEEALTNLASVKFIPISQITDHAPRPLQVITDQNMITEFRYGRWSGAGGG